MTITLFFFFLSPPVVLHQLSLGSCPCCCHVCVFVPVCPRVLHVSAVYLLSLSTHQPGAWLDSLGTDVNKLCLRQSQTQNVCEHD